MTSIPPSLPAAQTALSATSQKLIANLATSFGKDALKSDRLVRERRAAIAALVDDWLDTQDEPARTSFFAFLEEQASATQRKKIATHPLRPSAVSNSTGEPALAAAASARKPTEYKA